jgi:tRNA G46 methylase TrmB
MKDLTNFDWGWMDEPSDVTYIHSDGREEHMGQFHKQSIIGEIFERNCYETFFQVESGDIVLDIGASVGPFTYSILHKNPKQVFCFEPSKREFVTLCKNIRGHQVIPIPKGISNVNSLIKSDKLFGGGRRNGDYNL